jgi:hypothetical protein
MFGPAELPEPLSIFDDPERESFADAGQGFQLFWRRCIDVHDCRTKGWSLGGKQAYLALLPYTRRKKQHDRARQKAEGINGLEVAVEDWSAQSKYFSAKPLRGLPRKCAKC